MSLMILHPLPPQQPPPQHPSFVLSSLPLVLESGKITCVILHNGKICDVFSIIQCGNKLPFLPSIIANKLYANFLTLTP